MNIKINKLIFILLLYSCISSCARKEENNLHLILEDKPYTYEDFKLAKL